MSDNTPDDSETCCVCLDKFNKVDNETKYDGIYGPKIDDNLGYTHNCSHYKQICINCQNKIIKQNNNNCPLCREPALEHMKYYNKFLNMSQIDIIQYTNRIYRNEHRAYISVPLRQGKGGIVRALVERSIKYNISHRYIGSRMRGYDFVISNPPYN